MRLALVFVLFPLVFTCACDKLKSSASDNRGTISVTASSGVTVTSAAPATPSANAASSSTSPPAAATPQSVTTSSAHTATSTNATAAASAHHSGPAIPVCAASQMLFIFDQDRLACSKACTYDQECKPQKCSAIAVEADPKTGNPAHGQVITNVCPK